MIDIAKERPLSLKRAAQLMDVSQRTIIRWFDQGLERTKLGGRVYTSREALNRFSRRNVTRPEDDPEWDQRQEEAAAQLAALGIW